MGVHSRTSELERLKARLVELLEGGLPLRGTLSLRRRRCGKARCKCAGGALHASWYLIQADRGKLRQLSIPRRCEPQVRAATDRYRELRGILERLSELCWRQVEAARGRPAAESSAATGRKRRLDAGLRPSIQ